MDEEGGAVALERYAMGNDASSRWTSFSVAKSVTSTLVGAALDLGKTAEPYWVPLFKGYEPVAAWLARKRPDVLVYASEPLERDVTIGGPITKGKGINLPDTGMSVPSLTPHDFKCIDPSR